VRHKIRSTAKLKVQDRSQTAVKIKLTFTFVELEIQILKLQALIVVQLQKKKLIISVQLQTTPPRLNFFTRSAAPGHCGPISDVSCWRIYRVVLMTAHGNYGSHCFQRRTVAKFFSVSMMTREPMHLTGWNFAWTFTLTTCRSLLNIKVIGQRSRSHAFFVCFCVHDTAATRGQYLSLSKALQSWKCALRALVLE